MVTECVCEGSLELNVREQYLVRVRNMEVRICESTVSMLKNVDHHTNWILHMMKRWLKRCVSENEKKSGRRRTQLRRMSMSE